MCNTVWGAGQCNFGCEATQAGRGIAPPVVLHANTPLITPHTHAHRPPACSYTFKPLLDVALFTRSLSRVMGYRRQFCLYGGWVYGCWARGGACNSIGCSGPASLPGWH